MKDIKGYENIYGITSCGKVWSYKYKKFLKPNDNRDGYVYVNLYRDDKRTPHKIHRVVTEAHLTNN